MSGMEAPLLMAGAGMLAGSVLAPKTPKMPKQEKAKTMPMIDDEASRKAKRQSIAAQQARSGRASTILTNEEDLLGG